MCNINIFCWQPFLGSSTEQGRCCCTVVAAPDWLGLDAPSQSDSLSLRVRLVILAAALWHHCCSLSYGCPSLPSPLGLVWQRSMAWSGGPGAAAGCQPFRCLLKNCVKFRTARAPSVRTSLKSLYHSIWEHWERLKLMLKTLKSIFFREQMVLSQILIGCQIESVFLQNSIWLCVPAAGAALRVPAAGAALPHKPHRQDPRGFAPHTGQRLRSASFVNPGDAGQGLSEAASLPAPASEAPPSLPSPFHPLLLFIYP